MNFIQKISNFFKQGPSDLIKTLPDSQILVEAELRRNGNTMPSTKIQYQSLLRNAQNLNKWKRAVSAATDPEQPAWLQLHELYDNLLLDNHLRSTIESRIMYVQRNAFKMVNDAGEENKDISYLLERPWMEELINKVLMSKYQGAMLIELFELNPNGELAQINTIPHPHFNTLKGIITLNPDDNSGVQYKEGVYANYYVQVGKNKDLGLLERIAPIVLAKKLAMGSYQDYVEKFGVPPLFITTDREDDGRMNELVEAAKNFKSNQFMVGRGKEHFEIGKTDGSATGPFLDLMNYANEEISKAILGGSGLTDEKAYVGSSEIQYKLAKDRFESDKLFFKYIFNEEIKPRLVKLSPVYAPLEKHYFDWDNTETLDMHGIIDTIQKIGSIYDIDPDYVSEITGIPILGFKEQPNPFGASNQPAGGEDKGK